MIGVKLNKTLW